MEDINRIRLFSLKRSVQEHGLQSSWVLTHQLLASGVRTRLSQTLGVCLK